ncbi:MAG: DUF2335 domain-containing protein [Rickettsia endosymbiont of Bryobia graminum]|nr:DUF2335 domain-containing protein [Rickettsia endosymbiont of Bryobia graminum]
MRDNKSFFSSNNRLNKGYSKSTNQTESNNRFYSKKLGNILPPMDLMEEYESIYPGTIARMIAMAEKEQEHRHKKEKQNILAYAKNIRTARIYVILFLIISAISTGLLARESVYVASIFAISLFLTISIGIFLISYSSGNRRERNRK